MEGREIDDILSASIVAPYKFKGVFSLDELLYLPTAEPGDCMVVNTDEHWRPGMHWIALMCPIQLLHGSFIFFDSFGLPLHLQYSSYLNVYMTRAAHRVITAPWPVQNVLNKESTACGPFTIFILTQLPKYSDNLRRLVEAEFSKTNLAQNDYKVWKYINHLKSGLRNI